MLDAKYITLSVFFLFHFKNCIALFEVAVLFLPAISLGYVQINENKEGLVIVHHDHYHTHGHH
jgi:hypothetical protein